MEINNNMIVDRIKTNLDTLKIFEGKLDKYKDKLEELNEILRPTPKKHKVMELIKKQKRYISIFLAMIREDLFFLMDANRISVPQFHELVSYMLETRLIHKRQHFYNLVKNATLNQEV